MSCEDCKKLSELILTMHKEARAQGMFIGMGRSYRLPNCIEHQEGPKWREIRELAAAINKKVKKS